MGAGTAVLTGRSAGVIAGVLVAKGVASKVLPDVADDEFEFAGRAPADPDPDAVRGCNGGGDALAADGFAPVSAFVDPLVGGGAQE